MTAKVRGKWTKDRMITVKGESNIAIPTADKSPPPP
jgi:hypothetical protein